MNKYNQKAKCPKCGCEIILAKYIKNLDGSKYKEYKDIMIRSCSLCGYSWEELPLDYDGEEDEESNEQYTYNR